MARKRTEEINIGVLCDLFSQLTPTAIKIKESFQTVFGVEISEMINKGGTRGDHYDLILKLSNGTSMNCEVKHSTLYKPIDYTKPLWASCVQAYNGDPKPFGITTKYAHHFYDHLPVIQKDLNISVPIPPFDEWIKDAFRQGKPLTPFVQELREKGYKSEYLSEQRKNCNRTFRASISDLLVLQKQVYDILSKKFEEKDCWLQLHGDIAQPETFHVRWSEKLVLKPFISCEQLRKKSDCDIVFRFICDDHEDPKKRTKYCAKLRWGYGQFITNIRLDIA
jgi:hypothetical protein